MQKVSAQANEQAEKKKKSDSLVPPVDTLSNEGIPIMSNAQKSAVRLEWKSNFPIYAMGNINSADDKMLTASNAISAGQWKSR